jgi:formylglycine-generating enzyme required for sulfatase activity
VRDFIEPRSGIEFVFIPAGEFVMGAAEEDDARPLHPVRLPAFWMSRTEITREQYRRFITETKRAEPAHWGHELFARPGSPVIGVTWEDAAAFCAWCGGRLPTEAEWEYAARGADGRRYPWGNEPPDRTRAVFHRDIGFDGTAPVGSAKGGASPFGLLDMAGSVFEWCADWYAADYYSGSPVEQPRGPSTGTQRVIRGGAWVSLPDACRAAARQQYPPDKPSILIGARVARSSPPLP